MKSRAYKFLRFSLFIIFPLFLGFGPTYCSFLDGLFYYTCGNPNFNVEVNDADVWWSIPDNNLVDLYVADSGHFFLKTRGFCETVAFEGVVTGNPNLNGVAQADDFVGSIMVGDSGRIILLDTDVQINDIPNPAGTHNLNAVVKYEFMELIAVGDSGTIIKSTDAGLTWETVNSPTTHNLTDVGIVFQNQMPIIFITGDDMSVFRSTDIGNSWSQIFLGAHINSNITNSFNRVYFYNDSVGYIGGPSGIIGKTTDGGQGWTTLFCPGFIEITDFYFTSPDSGVAVGTFGIARFTTDGGLSWAEDTVATNLLSGRTVNAIYGVKEENYAVIIGEDDMLILLTPDSTLLSADDEEIENPSEYNLSYNYPNPFNPTTKIKYTIPVGTRDRVSVQMKIYDILGNEVATLVNEEKPAGEYEVEFNAYGLSSGIYFYRLTAGTFTETKKLVLLR